MESLDDLALRHIARFLDPKDIVRLGRTCKRMHSVMPRVVLSNEEWRGEDFHIFGPGGGHWCPELYFDAPTLTKNAITKLSLSVIWNDQGWGNRKGELLLKLMRPVSYGEPVEVAEHRRLFGIAEHIETEASAVIANHPVVTQARPGDFYRFMRNAGGGGGHSLTVKNFRAVATVCKVMH